MKKEYLFKIFVLSLVIIVVVFTITQLVFYAQKFNSNIKHSNNIKHENVENNNLNLENPNTEYSMENFYNDNIINKNLNYIANIYPDFFEVLKSANIKLPFLNDMIPQGIAIVDNNILITAYDYNEEQSSLVYVLNRKGKIINKVMLNTTSHVGSIIYDEKNNLIWIPDNDGVLNVYDSNEFLYSNYVEPKYQFNNISSGLKNYNDKTKQEIAYLCIDDDMLYIGSFSNMGKGRIKKYQIIYEENNIKLKFKKNYLCPILVQGMTFYNTENGKYLILSSSYGQKNDSHLQIYKFDDSKRDITNMKRIKLTFPPMLEQIMVKNDNLYILFESNASKYQETKVKVEELCALDIKKIIEKFNN